MKKKTLLALSLALSLMCNQAAYPLFGVGDIVYDPAAFEKLVLQIEKMQVMIRHLKNTSKDIDAIREFAKLDHVNLASKKFGKFLGEYKDQFDNIMNQIKDYQGGGLMGALDQLESRYPGYHASWEGQEGADDEFYEGVPDSVRQQVHAMKKQLLLTRIQMKHALMVGEKVRASITEAQNHTHTLLDDTAQAVGVMQSIKIGNELSGMVAKSVQTLNVQMGEYTQAYAAAELERNQRKGAAANRSRELLEGFGKSTNSKSKLPLNPIGKL